ncbi:MAG: FAD-binding protein [Planctomycetota bacterium]
MRDYKRVYDTDVLVIGGGGAATAATISASERGVRTMLGVKGQFGVPGVRGAGATSNPLADFWTIRTVGPDGSFFNPPDAVYQDMLRAGLGMAVPDLCRIYVDEVSGAVRRLRDMGMKFRSKMLATMPAGERSKVNGIVSIQKAIIEETKTAVLERANFTDLIVRDGRCVGAMGIRDDGEVFVVHAGAVILATGGVGQLFRFSFNPPGNTGDGYAMALRAGTELTNMEFMQQGLATTWPEKAMVMLYEMKEPYRLFNAQGKEFVGNYLSDGATLESVSTLKATHWPVSCRDDSFHLDRAIHGEALAGRATDSMGVFIDLSSARRGFEPQMFVDFMRSRGIDPSQDLLQVQIHHHTSNGGVVIDSDAQSSLPGLFAIGETAAWQGADRLGGTMLGGSQVFGWRAGAKAAASASEGSHSGGGIGVADELQERVDKRKEQSGDVAIEHLLSELQDTMWRELLVEKDAAGLERAMHCVEVQRERLEAGVAIPDSTALVASFEQQNLLDIAEVIIRSASERKESRGSHYRSDFPERDDANWGRRLLVSRSGDSILVRPSDCRESILDDGPMTVRISPWG